MITDDARFPALTDFRAGFHDGYHDAPKQPGRTTHYTHAYKAGTEARKRDNEHKETRL